VSDNDSHRDNVTGIPGRRDVAMTGEITRRGRVWPIAGLKEKLLAALRGGIQMVLIPEENAKDLVEISDSVKRGLKIIPVSRMDEALDHVLTRKPVPIVWDEASAKPPVEMPVEEEESSARTAH
jgi:ATP-dependent Lon protease